MIRLLLVVDPGADSILMEVRKAVQESTDDVYEFELRAVEALLSVSSKRLVRGHVHDVSIGSVWALSRFWENPRV